jgi:glutamyl-tRNA reductase
MGIGLESQVLGDLQIINQVKVAYQLTADLNMAGPFLHRLLHALFFLNKRIVQETRFRSGSASVSYATKELAEDLVQDKSKPVLVIGLGEIGIAVVRNLQENGFSNIRIANRTEEKAQEFLSQGMEFVSMEKAREAMASSTLTISALSGAHFQAGPEVFSQSNHLGFQYCIDLGMPRSIDPLVENNPKVILYNIDQIQTRVSEALAMRQQAVPQVEAIVAEGFAEFMEWSRDMAVSPLIQQMKSALETLRKEEMARFLKKAGDEQAAWADELTKNMVQRIMKSHIVQLKTACRRGDAENLTEALRQLFQVEAGTQV